MPSKIKEKTWNSHYPHRAKGPVEIYYSFSKDLIQEVYWLLGKTSTKEDQEFYAKNFIEAYS